MRTVLKIRLMLAISIMVAVLFIATMLLRHKFQTAVNPGNVTKGRDQSDLLLKGVRFTEAVDGKPKWVLNADTAEYSSDKSVATLSNINLKVTPFTGSVGEIVLTSSKAVYDSSKRKVYLSGKVRAVSESGMTFETSSARYDIDSAVISTRDDVRFIDSKLSLEGKGMEYSVRDAAMVIKQEVSAVLLGTSQK